MIHFLKEKTFVVNHVFKSSWKVLKTHYFSIAGLCLCLFVTSNASGVLAFYMQGINPILGVLMALVFVIAYFGIQLTLFKYILKSIDEPGHVSLFAAIPATKELSRYFAAMMLIGGIILVSYLLISLAAWPFIYMVGVDNVVAIGYVFSAFVTLYFLIRVAFYPFFIVDCNSKAMEAVRMSVALTKGNVLNLLLILACFALLHLLYIYFNYLGFPAVSLGLSLLNSFLVVPLSSVVVAIAYRNMVRTSLKELSN